MTKWADRVEAGLRVSEREKRKPPDDYAARARREDERTRRAVDRAARRRVTTFLGDQAGAAAARAPADADYLVKTANSGLSAERVVTDTTTIVWDFATAGQAKATRAALTGDVTASPDSNATTIAANVVDDGKLRQGAALSVIGRSANSTGNVADIAAGSDGDVLRRSGTTLGFGAIPESSVTNLVSDLAAKATTAQATTQLLWGISGAFVGATTYYAVPGIAALNTTEYRFVVPHGATVKNLYARVGTAPGAGQGVAITVRKNGSDQTLTCTITDTNTSANDTTHSFSVAAGDDISIKAVTTATGTPVDMTIGLELVAN